MPQSFSSARFIVFTLVTVFFAIGAYELMPSLTPGAAEKGLYAMNDESESSFSVGSTRMPTENPFIEPVLVGHRNQFVAKCVAGCGDGAKAVQVLPKAMRKRSMQFKLSDRSNDVTCLAGCTTR